VTYTPIVVGNQTISAFYFGDPVHTASHGNTTLTVLQRPTTTSVSCTPATLAPTQPSTCTATVHDTGPGTPTPPTGTIGFPIPGGVPALGGSFAGEPCTVVAIPPDSASCSVTYFAPISVGDQTISAFYFGDPVHTASHGNTTLTVLQRPTTTSVSCTPASLAPTQPTTCTATVHDTGPGTPTPPTGTIGFPIPGGGGSFAGEPCTVVAIPPDSASCSVTYTPIVVGNPTISAFYFGDPVHTASHGNTTLIDGSGGGSVGGGTGGGNPGATPELDSLVLFAAGAAGILGYGRMRLQAGRRRNRLAHGDPPVTSD
jgi:hypothetical protein